MFTSSYIHSTKACGYSNVENLARLQRSLKGMALEAVQGQLLIPDTVQEVINTLRMNFGRPDLILHTMIEEIKERPAVRPDKLESLIVFSRAVKNLNATVTSFPIYTYIILLIS